MQYIVLDLEWNQPEYPGKMVRDPVPLHGEIIQIGAVKLDQCFNQADTFKILVQPIRYKKMHKKVARITGLSEADFDYGFPFHKAISIFRRWCGEDFCFLTWGKDDEAILRNNHALYVLHETWIPKVYNVQYLFGKQVANTTRQFSLLHALEMLGEEPLPPHDALQDAMNTALVCRHLDMDEGITNYDEPIATKLKGESFTAPQSVGYTERSEALTDPAVCTFACPTCGKEVLCDQWERKKTEIRVTVAECPECSRFFVRIRFRQRADGKFKCTRQISPLTEELLNEYHMYAEENARKLAEWEAQYKLEDYDIHGGCINEL